jgi:hypothetical protein
MTTRQRAAMHKRIALALVWHQVPALYRDDANRTATHILDAIEDANFSAMALRRGTEAVLRSLDTEKSA